MTHDETMMALADTRTRDEAAEIYAVALDSLGTSTIRWATINTYLADRWSKSGMKYIKQRAWAIHDRKVLSHSAKR